MPWAITSVNEAWGPFDTEADARRWARQTGKLRYSYERCTRLLTPTPPPENPYKVGDLVHFEHGGLWYEATVLDIDGAVCGLHPHLSYARWPASNAARLEYTADHLSPGEISAEMWRILARR